MREEIQLMRQSLDAVLTGRQPSTSSVAAAAAAAAALPQTSASPMFHEEQQQAARTLLTVNRHHHSASGPPTGTPSNTTSPAQLSSREDNMQMAMTRENSLEPTSSGDQGNGPVTVEDPMGSLYEVTRLRNIRSNRSKTSRPLPGSRGELNDFISRGVISEAEAEELYEM